jgi:glc operon protein GlcG
MRGLIVAAVLLATPVAAQMAPPSGPAVAARPALTLSGARAVLMAAEAEAVKRGLKVSIAVVDPGGNPILHARMDEATLASIEISLGKARTSAGFNQPSKVMEDRLMGDRGLRILTLPGVMVDGAVPIRVDGKLVGAVGVSGATSTEDGLIAAAGAAVLAK